MKCPNCGHSVFQNDNVTLPAQSGRKFTAWDDVINTGGTMAIATIGGYAMVWQSGLETYWLAPGLGLVAGLGLNVLKLVLDRPTVKKIREQGITIDVRQRGKQSQQWYFDAFPGVRPSQLWQFSNAAINHNCPVSRREMKRYHVTEGQYSSITNCMVERQWVEVTGETENAPRVLTRNGRAVLRGVLASPDLTPGESFSGARHHPTTTPPRLRIGSVTWLSRN